MNFSLIQNFSISLGAKISNYFSTTILIIFIVLSVKANAQGTGSITGKITDKTTNEALIGANIVLLGTTTGASTDIDGVYKIENLKAGSYKIKVSYISYQPMIIENVKVDENQSAKLDVPLQPSVTQLDAVVITAEALKSTEASVLKIQKNSEDIVDGISAELISKNNSSDGADVLKRMTGVTISEGKYAYIRGVSDRYNSTMLNGSTLPSTDPEKKSFSYDIFPASLIQDVITSKTFTPDKPADFSGGLVQINTIEFPSNFIFNISTGGTYNTLTTGKQFMTYNGGRKDFLGYDDGTRSLPSEITSTKISRGAYSNSELEGLTQSFSNDWSTKPINAPINGSFKIDIGNKYDLSGNTFGFIGSVNYSNKGETKNLEKSFYDFSGPRFSYKGSSYTRSINLGGLLNLSYKFSGTNKISFKNVYNQNADDITTLYSGDYRYADQYRSITSMNYVSRSLLSNQLIGEHQFNLLNGIGLNWNLSYAKSKRDEPDARRFVYYRAIEEPADPLRFLMNESVDTRYYGNLNDKSINGSLDFNIKIFENPSLPKFKLGAAYNKKDRTFDARSFGFRNVPGGDFLREDSVLQSSVDQIFVPKNMTNKFIQVLENTKPSDSYFSKQIVNAGYLMFDATAFDDLRIVTGIRLENSEQDLNTIDLVGDTLKIENKYNDILPSVNLTYHLNEWINLRSAFSITLARPEFREMAPFSYFNFITNELIQGNPDLKRTLIRNYDFRVELYPGSGELVALSLFYKDFRNPIEETLKASANEPIRSFANADKAKNYGIEIEIRKSLGFISPFFEDFSFVGNGSAIKSKVELSENSYQQSERPLQGQAPYIINFGLYYDNLQLGLNTSLTYNKVGQRIISVGSIDLGNTLERPVDLIDFSVSKTVLNSLTLKFTVKDLLNQERVQFQQAPLPYGDQITEKDILGRNISFGITYKL